MVSMYITPGVAWYGLISKVGWFNTTVNGYEGTRVTVPNRRILDGTVIDKTNKRFRVCQKQLDPWQKVH